MNISHYANQSVLEIPLPKLKGEEAIRLTEFLYDLAATLEEYYRDAIAKAPRAPSNRLPNAITTVRLAHPGGAMTAIRSDDELSVPDLGRLLKSRRAIRQEAGASRSLCLSLWDGTRYKADCRICWASMNAYLPSCSP